MEPRDQGVLDPRPVQRRQAQSVAARRRDPGTVGRVHHAVYYPAENQIFTMLQQGDHFTKQEQRFSIVPLGPDSTLLQVDLDVEVKLPVPGPMVKKLAGETLEHLAKALEGRVEQLTQS